MHARLYGIEMDHLISDKCHFRSNQNIPKKRNRRQFQWTLKKWDSICCAQRFAGICFVAPYHNTFAVPHDQVTGHFARSARALGTCVLGTCISEYRHIHIPIYGATWHALTY